VNEQACKYNLGWYRGDIPTAASYLIYVLVPDGLGAFRGTLELERISLSGLPLKKVSAGMKDLASPRRPQDAEGVPLLFEQKLIRGLASKAVMAHNILPTIVPSLRSRAWSQLELTDRQRAILLRAGGVLP